MEVCRICLASAPEKHVDQLKTNRKDGHKDFSEILLFCLDIQITEHPEITKKLCTKCFKKILSFHKFKSMALKNDAYLKSVLHEEHIKLKAEPIQEVQYLFEPTNDNNSMLLKNAIKVEPNSEESCMEKGLEHRMLESLDVKKEALVGTEDEIHSNMEMMTNKGILHQFFSDEDNHELDNTESTSKVTSLYVSKLKRKPKIGKKKKSKLEGQIKDKKSHHGPNEGGVCDQCGLSVGNLRQHSLVHIPKQSRKRYPCPQCDKVFITRASLSVHRNVKHLGKLGHCKICNRDYACLQKHQLLVHNKDKLKVQCELCKSRFMCKAKLEIHMTLHTKEKPYQCDHCGKNFRIKLLLQQHIRGVHEQEKNYVCQHCAKAFFKKYHYMNHLRTHTKEKPYKCSTCEKAFATTTHLQNHQYSHRTFKEFHCKLCTVSFIRPGNLRTHMLSHSSEKKFPCRYCGVGFKRAHPRKKHEYEKHEKNT